MWIFLISDTREHLQMAAMMAYVAAVCEKDVRVFVSMNALAHFRLRAPDTTRAEGTIGEAMAVKNVPDFLKLFSMAAELGGAKIHPCRMSMDLMGTISGELQGFFHDPMDLETFLHEARHTQVLTF